MKITGLRNLIYNRLHREDVYSRSDYWDAKATELGGSAVSLWPNTHLNDLYHRDHIRTLERFIPNPSGKRVLDLGCGTGRISRWLAERGAAVVGIDYASKVVEIASQLSLHSGNPVYRCQSMFELDDRACFHHVVTWSSLAVACRERAQLEDVMRRVRCALVPSGVALFVEPFHRGFLHRVLNMELREVVAVIGEAGLEVTDTVDLHFWPARLLLAYLRWPRFVTVAGYQAGEVIMKLFRKGHWGDYKVVVARANAG